MSDLDKLVNYYNQKSIVKVSRETLIDLLCIEIDKVNEMKKVLTCAEDDLYHICLFNPDIKSKSLVKINKVLDRYKQ